MNHKQYFLGFDLGSSSVKASLVDAESGVCAASAFYPEHEAPIKALAKGWAEQNPSDWWTYALAALRKVFAASGACGGDILAIGISYQMHGLVCIDRDGKALRDSIIWCDSRAVPYGSKAMSELGKELCLSHLLNSPGNFTASKMAWVKENEPETFRKTWKMLLPGDYLALRLSGTAATTLSGLSEGMMWDFAEGRPASFLLDYYGIPTDKVADVVPTFGLQGQVSPEAAAETGLKAGTPICYRAGDQPNNALSLNVLNPGEVAATGGTSGVVYGVLGAVNYDPLSRVNTFAHVNHTSEKTRLGVLLCINGTGILNSWMRRNVAPEGMGYDQMNSLMAQVAPGSDGVCVIPFGNGAERVLENQSVDCSIHGVDFNRHTRAHLLRAAHEGIAFSFCYGMETMKEMGMDISKIHAGRANMFLSPVFRQTLSSVSGATISLCETDGSIGAARGAGIGCGYYKSASEAFASLKITEQVFPDTGSQKLREAYMKWKSILNTSLRA